MHQELARNLEQLPDSLDGGTMSEVEASFARIERDLAVQQGLLSQEYGQPIKIDQGRLARHSLQNSMRTVLQH